jgi:hypothetical protein
MRRLRLSQYLKCLVRGPSGPAEPRVTRVRLAFADRKWHAIGTVRKLRNDRACSVPYRSQALGGPMNRTRTTFGAVLAAGALVLSAAPAIATSDVTTSPTAKASKATAAKAEALVQARITAQKKYDALAKRLTKRMVQLQGLATTATSEGRTASAASYTTRANKYPALIARATALKTNAGTAADRDRLKALHREYVALILDIAKMDKGLKIKAT